VEKIMDKLLEPEVLGILAVFGLPLLIVIAYYCYKVAKINSDNELKRRLVERGLSVDEIERIINAGTEKGDD
jgi:hypothetical protein